MRLTRFSDIGLRLLMYLARAPQPARITVGDVSRYFDIPQNHLNKVAGALVKAGWVGATRGRAGGVHLAAAPAAIRVGAVLRVLEGDGEAIDCEGVGCRLASDCMLRSALHAGLDAFYAAMDGYTLADIVGAGGDERLVEFHRSLTVRRETLARVMPD